jgi:hypothetical protein
MTIMKSCRKGSWLVVFFILFLSNCSSSPYQPHLPDAQLIANFHAHKEEFERLRQMVIEDKGLTMVNDLWPAPDDPKPSECSQERAAEYRKLFSQLNLPWGISATLDRDRIEFGASAQGQKYHASTKGYLYTSRRPENLVDSLDNISSQDLPIGAWNRHIEGNWYIHFYGY